MELSLGEKEESPRELFEDDEGFLSTGDKGVPCFQIELDEKLLENCKVIIFGDGLQASSFCMNYILQANSKSVGKVEKIWTATSSPDIELWGLQDKKPSPSLFFKIDEEALLCICSPSWSSEDYYLFASSVLGSFKKQVSVIALTTSALSQYKSEVHHSELDCALMRILTTSNFPKQLKLAKLEQPNILVGAVAGILTVSEIKGIPAAACVVYSSSLMPEDGIIRNFALFLRTYDASLLKKIHGSNALPADHSLKTGNLYI